MILNKLLCNHVIHRKNKILLIKSSKNKNYKIKKVKPINNILKHKINLTLPEVKKNEL